MDESNNSITVFIFKKSFKDIHDNEAKDIIKASSLAIDREEKRENNCFLKIELSYDKNMKCLRAVVPNFEFRTKTGALCDLNMDDMSH